MRSRRVFAFAVLLCLAAVPSLAFAAQPQRACGTPDPDPIVMSQVRAALRARAGQARANQGATIPIAFHVITSNGVGDVTAQQITDQIRVLNQAYAGTGYRFTLSSVDRTENKNWFTMAPGTGSEKQAKQALAIDPAHTFNVYTCALTKNLLGWAYFPFSAPEDSYLHGVVFHYGSVPGGYLAPYNLGGTLIHESGHYLGLFHTFQGGCVEPGDEVDDTPFEASPAFGCPEGRNTCAQPGDDPIHNYMDYTDDACYTEFTPGQVARVNAIAPVYRPSLFARSIASGGIVGDGSAQVAAGALARGADENGMVRGGGGSVAFRGAFPNPFATSSALRFYLPATAHVSLAVYSVSGQRVRVLMDATLPPGEQSALVDGTSLAPGMYFAALRVDGRMYSRTIVRVK
jgi:hypothetical protein